MISRRVAILLLVTGALGGSALGGGFLWTGSSGASEKPTAWTAFSRALSKPATTDLPAGMAARPQVGSAWDLSQVRELARDLGPYHGRLLIWPGSDGRAICYELTPVMGGCSPLSDPFPALAGEHFSVSAPRQELGGYIGTQLFGVAFDDVVRVRVRVNGEWRPVSQYGNGFYVDLPNVLPDWCTARPTDSSGSAGTMTFTWNCEPRDEVLFEATLEDGTVQLHDIRTDRRVS
jgi:hypothetical protein